MENRLPPESRGEGRPDVNEEHQAALLIDFDNVTMGIRSNLGQELRNLLNSDVIRGKVAVQRAYADWRRYPQYIVPLSEASIDLIFAPAYGSSKKNATDIRLAIDALELVFVRPEIRTYILMSGDSDFSSLVLKLKEYGKYVIGVGIQESSSDLLVQNCDEYYSYTSLSGLSKAGEGPVERHDPWVLVEKAVARMVQRGDTMRSDRLKQVMLEIDSTFDEKEQGFSKFNRFMVEAASRGLISIQKMENGQYGVAPAAGAKAGSGEKKREERKRTAGEEDGRESRRGGRRRRGEAEKPQATGAEPGDETGGTSRARPKLTMKSALELLDKALGQLLEDADDAVRDSDVKRRLLELHPQFDEGELGFNKFSKFLQAAEESGAVQLSRGPNRNYYVARRSRSRKRARPEKPKKQRTPEPSGAVEVPPKESRVRKLARFLFGESPEHPEDRSREPAPTSVPKPSAEERGRRGAERPRDRAAAGGERSPEGRRDRREERADRGRQRGERGPEGRSERRHETGRRERGPQRGERRGQREEGERRGARESQRDRMPRSRGGAERGRGPRPESRTEREERAGRREQPSSTRVTGPEEDVSEAEARDRPGEGVPAALTARDERGARPSDRPEPSARVEPGAPDDAEPTTAKEADQREVHERLSEPEPGVMPAPMPGAPRGTIRGRWGSRGRYRPPSEQPPILEGQSKPGGDQETGPAEAMTGRRQEDPAEPGNETAPPGDAPEEAEPQRASTHPVSHPLVDRLTGYAGIGAKTAERLVEAFGEEVIRVIDDQPERVRHLLSDHRAEAVIRAREEERRLEASRNGED